MRVNDVACIYETLSSTGQNNIIRAVSHRSNYSFATELMGIWSMTPMTAYTPLETLLVFQSLAKYGTEPSAFSQIAEVLKGNPLIRETASYDNRRLSPEALRGLYDELLSQETESEGIENTTINTRATRDGTPTFAARKRKRESPPVTETGNPTDGPHLLSHLISRLYARYQERVIGGVREDEQQYQNLERDITSLERGEWDAELVTEHLATQTTPANGGSIAGEAESDTEGPRPQDNGDLQRERSSLLDQTNPEARHPELHLKETELSNIIPLQADVPTLKQQDLGTPTLASTPALDRAPSDGYQHLATRASLQVPPANVTPIQSTTQTRATTPLASHGSAAAAVQVPSTKAPSSSHTPQQATSQGTKTFSFLPPAVPNPPSQQFQAPSGGVSGRKYRGPYAASVSEQKAGFLTNDAEQTPKSFIGVQPPSSVQSSAGGPPILESSHSGSGPSTPGYAPGPHDKEDSTGEFGKLQPESTISSDRTATNRPRESSEATVSPNQMQIPSRDRPDLHQTANISTPAAYSARPPPLNTSTSATKWKARSGSTSIHPPHSPEQPPHSPLSDVASPQVPAGRARRTTGRNADSSTALDVSPDMDDAEEAELQRTRRGSRRKDLEANQRENPASQATQDESEAAQTPRETQKIKRERPRTPAGLSDDQESDLSLRASKRLRRSTLEAQEDRSGSKRKRSTRGTPETMDVGAAETPGEEQQVIPTTRNFSRTTAPLLNDIIAHKYSGLFSGPIKERDAPGYYDIIYHPQNIKSIKSAIAAGSRAVAAVNEATDTPLESPGGALTPSKQSIGAVPSRAIVNSTQLEKETVRMFANAVMFNPDPDRGIEYLLEKRKQDTMDDEYQHLTWQTQDNDTEGGVVKDTREMFSVIEKAISDWRSAEQQPIERPPSSSRLNFSSAKAGRTSGRLGTRGGSAEGVTAKEGNETSVGTPQTTAGEDSEPARRRSRV